MLWTVSPSCFSSFPLVFRWAWALHVCSWARLGLELMGSGISTNSKHSHLNESSFVPFQAATSAGRGFEALNLSAYTFSYLLCRRTLASVWLSHKSASVFLRDSTKHISLCAWVSALFGNLCLSTRPGEFQDLCVFISKSSNKICPSEVFTNNITSVWNYRMWLKQPGRCDLTVQRFMCKPQRLPGKRQV